MKKFFFILVIFSLFVVSCDNLYNDVAEEKKDMQKLIFVNADGVSVDLTKDPFGITEWEGFSKVDLNLQTQQVPFHDGSVYLDGLLSERELSVTLAMNDEKNLEKRYRLRRELIEILNPKLGEGTLIYTNNYTSKQIKVVPQTPLFENHNSNDSGTPKASLAWTACSPYWEDVEETVSFIDNGMPITLTNNGDVPTNVKINIEGDSENFKVINQTTGKCIELKNIEDLGLCEIDTLFGEKKAINYDNVFKLLNGSTILGLYGNDKLTIYVGRYICVEDINGNLEFINSEKTLYDVTYGNGKYVAVGEDGTIIISENGYSWNNETSPVSEKLNSIAYGNGKYVAVGEDGTIITSENAVIWNVATSPTTKDLINVIFGGGKWVVNGTNVLLNSIDTSTWNIIIDQNINIFTNSAIYVNDRFYLGAVGTSGFAYPHMSSDGENWTTFDIALHQSTYPTYNCKYLASDGTRMIVSDGSTGSYTFLLPNPEYGVKEKWNVNVRFTKIKYITEQRIYKSLVSYYIGYGLNIYNWSKRLNFTYYTVMYGLNKFILYSTQNEGGFKSIFETIDGTELKYITRYSNFSPTYGYFREGLFIVIGKDGKIRESNNGEVWTEQQLSSQDYLNCISSGYLRYSENQLVDVIVGNNGIYMRANNGLFSKVVTTTNVYGVTFGNGICLAIGTDALYRKRGGTPMFGDWEYLFLGYHNWKSIAYGNGVFVIVGDSGWIAVTDGSGTGQIIDGRLRNDVTNENINIVVFAENKFIMATESGKLYKSYNGYDWYFINNINCPVYQIAFGNNQYLLCGNYMVLAKNFNYEKSNVIDKITTDSDMNFDLVKGDNNIKINYDGKDMLCKISFRQKYLGV